MDNQDEQWLLKEKYNGEKSAAFFADCKQLALGEPLGYLIGHIPFLGCTIHLDGRPLIPRPETEFWVEQAIAAISEGSQLQPGLDGSAAPAPHVLDLCAGSGCIGVAVAKQVPQAHVDFAEIDAHLLPTIEKNLKENGIDSERTTSYHSNLFQTTPTENAYDFILSNPPYIDSALHRVDENVKEFEPHVALFGGQGGVEVIEQLIAAAPAHLRPGGQLWIEHEPEQIGAIADTARTHNFAVTHHPDQYDVLRYSILVLQ